MPSTLAKIQHLVVVMLENRSFDNLLGFLYAGENNRPPRNLPAHDPPSNDLRTAWSAAFQSFQDLPAVQPSRLPTSGLSGAEETELDIPAFLRHPLRSVE